MLKRFISVALFWVVAANAHAGLVHVTIDAGTTFFDGTSLSGSFSYDTDTDSYFDVNLSTDAGFMVSCSDVGTPGDFSCDAFDPVLVVGYEYDTAILVSGDNLDGTPIAEPNLFGFGLFDITDDGVIERALFLSFASELSTGGTIAMAMTEYFCTPPGCGFDIESTIFRNGAGTVTAKVPEPSTLGLLGLGLLGLTAARRKRA